MVQISKQGSVKQLLESSLLNLYRENLRWTAKDVLNWKGSGTNLEELLVLDELLVIRRERLHIPFRVEGLRLRRPQVCTGHVS